MDRIDINSYVTEKDPRHPVKCYVHRPDQPAMDRVMEKMGWKRKDLLEGDYFYWTESDLSAENTANRLGIPINEPNVAPVWKIDYEPEGTK